MTNPYPLPRETRETPILAGDGRATYGPFGFRIWDVVDVTAVVSRNGGEFRPEGVRAEKTTSEAFAPFIATFTPALSAADRVVLRSTRLHQRQTDVVRGNSISGDGLERELSKQGTVLQESRRDIDHSLFALGELSDKVTESTGAISDAIEIAEAAAKLLQSRIDETVFSVAGRVGDIKLVPDDVDGLDRILRTKADARALAEKADAEALAANDRALAANIRALRTRAYDAPDELFGTGLFEASGTANVEAQELREHRTPFNPTTDLNRRLSYAASAKRINVAGGKLNGPHHAAVGQAISMFKEGFNRGTAKGGEMDGLYIVIRQDSPRTGNVDQADACGILIDTATFDNVGFVGGIEGMSRVLTADGTAHITRQGYQLGCIATNQGGQPLSVGLHLSAYEGASPFGLLISAEQSGGGTWLKPISVNQSGRVIFELDNAGRLAFRPPTGATVRTAIYTSVDGNFGVLNDDFSHEMMRLSQGGDATFERSVTAGLIQALTSLATPEIVLRHVGDAEITNTLRTNANGNFALSKDGVGNFNVSGAGVATVRAEMIAPILRAQRHIVLEANAPANIPQAGGVLYFEAQTGRLVYHNGSARRVISNTAYS